ncbi:MAG: Universal stress protein family [Nitrospira sp.]|jgi:nucleotide-binding universal stress UspA family protein|nr:MAG: Universal stress protein family [Nitrospira sp.]
MNMMIAVDGSGFAEWSVQMLSAIADRPPETVTLLHVVDNTSLKSAVRKQASLSKQASAAMVKAGDQILRRFEGLARIALQQATTKPHTTIETVLAHGRVGDTITAQAKRKKVDLLVLGSRGLSDMESYLLGSVSRKVSALAPCSVLVVKRPLTVLSQVLFAADASQHTQGACSFLCKLLPESAKLTVCSVVEPVVTELAEKYLSKDQVDQLSAPKRQAAEQTVEKLRNRFLREGYAVTTQVRIDHVTDSLIRQAASAQVDLLVAGSRGLTKSERLRLGSVSETLLKYASCSVLIVRGWRA